MYRVVYSWYNEEDEEVLSHIEVDTFQDAEDMFDILNCFDPPYHSINIMEVSNV